MLDTSDTSDTSGTPDLHGRPGIAGILLAAGRGRRFDPSGTHNKLLQSTADGDTVVRAAARSLLAALPRVTAVVRAADSAVAAELAALGCEVVVCAQADDGMALSLVAGLQHQAQAAGWVIALGDMPYVQASTVAALREALREGAEIAVPVFAGRRGNPVAFARQHLPALLQLRGDQGARGLLQSCPVVQVPVDDAGIHQDIDRPHDLR